MKGWKMTTLDFHDLLKQQDHRCFLSGKILTPQTVRIVKISLETKPTKANVCLVHEILAPLARKWSIADVRMICIQIAHYSQGKEILDPKNQKIKKKSQWQLALDRISNFNKSTEAKKASRKAGVHTWGQIVSSQVNLLNRDKASKYRDA